MFKNTSKTKSASTLPEKKGLGLLYLDIDAHHSWQTDEIKAKELLQRLFPFGYFRQSGRGQNGYLKIRYSSIEEFNETAEKLQALLRQLFLQFEIRCDIEVNGKITHKGKSGSLAKLPFKVDVWNGDQLELFKACPVVSIRRVSQIACQIAGLIDENRVVSQPTENTPAGRMQRRVLASMASFYTEQQSLDVREGLARRVQSGLFVSKPHFGSRNIRINGRSIVEIHPEKATVVRRAYELYAYHNHTLGTLSEVLYAEGMSFTIHGFRATI